MDSVEEIRQKLNRLRTRRLEESFTAEAAVLVALLEREGEMHFLLTERTLKVGTHRGQISFPGGLREACDPSLCQTALRETKEEVGIEAEFIEVLGSFHQYMAITGFRVTPFVAFLKGGFTLTLNSQEVEKVLIVPVNFFRINRPRIEIRHRLGKQRPVYFYEYAGDTIWGLTATMIRDFIAFLDD